MVIDPKLFDKLMLLSKLISTYPVLDCNIWMDHIYLAAARFRMM